MDSKPLKLITTDDGSHSLFVPELNETYHSFHGAVQESRHVFINMGLDHFKTTHQSKPLTVFEVGLGTGLNALLTAEWASKYQIPVSFYSIEAYPIPNEFIPQLNYAAQIQPPDASLWLNKIHNSDWEIDIPIHDHMTIRKIHAKLANYPSPKGKFDVIFFDAFAPNKQEEMWTYERLQNIYKSMASQSIFVTYCAKGQLKRDLKEIGFTVETLPGPPGKKEMVRGIKSH